MIVFFLSVWSVDVDYCHLVFYIILILILVSYLSSPHPTSNPENLAKQMQSPNLFYSILSHPLNKECIG